MLIDHLFLMQFPGIVLYKDKSSRYIGCSREFSSLLGYKKPELAIGSNDYELPCDAVNNAKIYIEEDRKVISENRKLSFLQISRLADGLIHALYYQKAPFIDFEENKLAGILCQGFAINSVFISNIYKLFTVTSHKQQSIKNFLGNYKVESELDCEFYFSEREKECLFYLLRGKTAKEIAKILAISHRTVESYIDNLKYKAHTKSKGELIDFAFQNGYQNKIPKSIFCEIMKAQ